MKQPTAQDIIEFRNSVGLTQVELAGIVFVSERQVQYWEAGRNDMPIGLWELAQIKMLMDVHLPE